MSLKKDKGIALFTDGSGYHGENAYGGWAWLAIDAYDHQLTGTGSVLELTTSNRMEMTAWIEGLNEMFRSLGPCQILVYSDSQYVGYGAMDRSRKRRKNVDLWNLIDQAVDQHEYVEFCWVKGHTDSHYNDIVDRLAGEARKEAVDARSQAEIVSPV